MVRVGESVMIALRSFFWERLLIIAAFGLQVGTLALFMLAVLFGMVMATSLPIVISIIILAITHLVGVAAYAYYEYVEKDGCEPAVLYLTLSGPVNLGGFLGLAVRLLASKPW